jgi:P27 family predicted phage terminase small subunit
MDPAAGSSTPTAGCLMGRRGPAPAPTALKLLRGERKRDRLNPDEPEPADNDPRMPADLPAPARRVWRRVMAEMGAAGVIRAADADVLRVYCECVARYEEASVLLARSSPLIRGARTGELVKNPLHQIVRDLGDQVRVLARELGLSPSARAGLRSPSAGMPDPFDDFLARGRRSA